MPCTRINCTLPVELDGDTLKKLGLCLQHGSEQEWNDTEGMEQGEAKPLGIGNSEDDDQVVLLVPSQACESSPWAAEHGAKSPE